jgi:hypothetical protein
MAEMFLICSVIGGTALVFQFALTLLGLGGDMDGGGTHGDLGALPHDLPHDAGGPFVSLDTDHADAHPLAEHTSSTWLFGVVSLRTMVAATTFFGLGGYASLAADQTPMVSLAIAIVCGATAMVGVHQLLQFMHRLSQDRTQRIDRAVGVRGKVYIPIPGNRQGQGKIQLAVQNRLLEYAAVTSHGHTLTTGTVVVVTRIVDSTTVEVQVVDSSANVTLPAGSAK